MAIFYQGRPITIATQGALRWDTPLTVGVNGVLEPLTVSVETNIILGGSAGVTTSLGHSAAGIVILGGSVPVTIAIAGKFEYDYTPSADGTVVASGDALIVAKENGVLSVDYTPMGGERVGGSSVINITMNQLATGGLTTGGTAIAGYFANNTHIATGGLVTGGQADIVFDPNTVYVASGGILVNGSATTIFAPIEGERGGKGVPIHRRTIQPQRQVYLYTADALRERKVYDTDFGFVLKGKGVVAAAGTADTIFIPAKYQFIKTLPRLPKPELVPDSEFLTLYKEWEKRRPGVKHSYTATGGLQLTGQSTEEYFDFQNFIITHDDELIIADILSTEENPFLTTRYDLNLTRQRKDDNDLLEILELF